MKRVLFCIAWAILLSACAGDAQTRATSALAIGCDTVASTLDQLAPRRARGDLSPQAIFTVNTTKGVTDKVCLPDSPFDPATAASIVQNAITILKGI